MARTRTSMTLLFTALFVSTPALIAAPKAKKPLPKKTPPRVVQGTKQLSGDQAVFGQVYTLGKEFPINYTLKSAEYSTARLKMGDEAYIPGKEEKFLVLHYTVHNPQTREALFRFDTLRYTAVDSTNTNQEGSENVGVESTHEKLDMELKPGQKIDGYTYVTVPAGVSVPKLIVKASDNLVLRYDLTDKIKPLAGPALDTSDSSGVKALGEIPAKVGTLYEMGPFDVTITDLSYSTKPIKDQDLPEGGRYLVATLQVKNTSSRQELLRFDTFRVKALDADGAEVDHGENLLTASRDAGFDSEIAAGKEVRVRTVVPVEKDQVVKTLDITTGDNLRHFLYDVSSVQ